MTELLERIDHVHVLVGDRTEAEQWYANTLRFKRVSALESWATERGPLMLGQADGGFKLALFAGIFEGNQSTIAFSVKGEHFLKWRDHLEAVLGTEMRVVDHGLAWSIYFSDPWGNPFEITSYDYEAIVKRMS